MRLMLLCTLVLAVTTAASGGQSMRTSPSQSMAVEATGDIQEAGELAGDDRLAEEALIAEVTEWIADAARRENCSWYECGVVTPKEEYDDRARRIATSIRTALVENGLSHPFYLWGSVGIMWQESRGNPCPFGPYSRQWAISKKLVREKHMVWWNTDDALKVMQAMLSGKVKRRGVDSGIGQTIWPHNSKVRMPDGTVRTATPEEMVTVEGSAKAMAYHMQQNAQLDPRRDEKYGEKIEWWVKRNGGPNIGPKARWQ
jgi:hypothetical protein